MVENKVVFITGAFGLIGYSISKNFLDNGANVVLADIQKEKISKIEEELKSAGYNIEKYLVIDIDITDEDSIAAAMKSTLSKFGRADVLINSAAIDAKFDQPGKSDINESSFENYPAHLLKRSVEVNTIGTVLITQVFCRQMLLQGYGNIINVASIYALVSPNQSLYDFGDEPETLFKPVDYIVSKSFIPNFTRYVATFYARKNIRCNAIAPPGVFNNHDKKFLVNFEKLSPIGRMCEVNELHGVFKFLASDESAYMTGSTVIIDGGWTAW
jgi:NAD(P)-dependent dehydrogenase (short-subunit alcohol dehydrogenase family)